MAGLGDVLVERGVVTPEQLQHAETQAGHQGGSVAKALVELGYSSEADLVRALAASMGMDFVDLDTEEVSPDAAGLLSLPRARDLGALPVRLEPDGTVLVAVADPKDQATVNALETELGSKVTLAMTLRRSLLQAIDMHAGNQPAGADAWAAPHPGSPPPLRSVDGGGGGQPAPPHAAAAVPGAAAGVSAAPPSSLFEDASSIDLDTLLSTLLERGGSDLHLTSGIPPAIRIDGDLVSLDDYPRLDPDELQKMLYGIMTQKQRERFENELELDMSYALPGKGRFRVNVFQQRDAVGSVMRAIPFEIKELEQLGIPQQVANFAYLPRGFVLVTGPTGSGKSTTLASLIDLINRNRPVHIMTVEDPIEFLHNHKRAVVNQREVGTDTHGFAQALKHVLRQDPDVILVGEMRDLETIQIALTAAETGHLVFGTLHTQDAPQTIDRVVDVFPPHQQEQIRVMLAGALKGVVCQTLLKTSSGDGRIAATEILVATSGIRNLIREGKTHQIYSAIQAGASQGMVAMDQSLATLVKAGKVTYDAALEKCNDTQEFNRLAGRR